MHIKKENITFVTQVIWWGNRKEWAIEVPICLMFDLRS